MTGRKLGLPRISFSMWWKLRKELQKSPDITLTPDNIAFLLNIALSTVRTVVLPPLRQTGLITHDGFLTGLGHRWLNDDEYKTVCHEITDNIYPELKTSIPKPLKNGLKLKKWFSERTGSTPKVVQQLAASYLMLYRADPGEQNEDRTRKTILKKPSRNGSSFKRVKTSCRKPNVTDKIIAENKRNGKLPDLAELNYTNNSVNYFKTNSKISININIKFNLTQETSVEQIQVLFAGIGKYLL